MNTSERIEETILISPVGDGPCEFTVTYAPGRPVQTATFRGVKADVLVDGSLVIYTTVEFMDGVLMDPQPFLIIPAGQYLQCRMTSYKRVSWKYSAVVA